jgi:hypothetical protein
MSLPATILKTARAMQKKTEKQKMIDKSKKAAEPIRVPFGALFQSNPMVTKPKSKK